MSYPSPYPQRPERPQGNGNDRTQGSAPGSYDQYPQAQPGYAPQEEHSQYPPQPGYGQPSGGYGQPGGGGYYPQQPYNSQQPQGGGQGNTLAIIGLVASFLFAPVGLVLSILGFRKSSETGEGRGLSIAGIVVSALGILGGILWFFLVFLAVGNAASDFDKAMDDLEKSQPGITQETPGEDTTGDDGGTTSSAFDTVAVPEGNERTLTLDGGDVDIANLDTAVWVPSDTVGMFTSSDSTNFMFFQVQQTFTGATYEDAVADTTGAFFDNLWGGYAEGSGSGAIISQSEPYFDQYGNLYATVSFAAGDVMPENTTVAKFVKGTDQVMMGTVALYDESGRALYEDGVDILLSMH